MMNAAIRELEDLKTKIHSFRVSDLQSLVASFGRSRNGKKQDLQNRALDILRTQPPDVDIIAFKRKIYELFRIAQDEAKQTHYDFQPQQRSMNQPGNTYMAPAPYTLPPQQTRPAGNAIIYQNGGIVSGNGYPPNANVYPGPMVAPNIQPPTVIASNLGDTVQIMPPPLTHTNIKFKSLPFYRIKHEVLKPTILKLKTNVRNSNAQVFPVNFLLTCGIANDISMHRDVTKNEFIVQAQLRITAIDNSNTHVTEYDDLLPLGLLVRMNEKPCPLPPCSPCVRPNVETRRVPLPINISPHMRLSPMNINKLAINWNAEVGRTFVACVNIVEKLSSNYLLSKLQEKPPISVDITKEIIAKQYKRVIDDDDDNEDADDDDIATTIVRVSLQCPLAKFRMMHPAKGKNCGHLQCFDGFAYISCNEKKSVWMCPVCNRPLHYDDLLIDQYFVDVLASKESEDCQEVQLFVDGSWKVYEEDVTDLTEKEKTKSAAPESPSENLSLTSSEELFSHDGDQKHVVSDNAVSTSGISASVPDSFVDLTSDDDETEARTETRTTSEIEEELECQTSTNITNVPPDGAQSSERTASPSSESTQLTLSLTMTTPVVSPVASPTTESAQPTSCLTTPVISPASSPRLNLSPTVVEDCNEPDVIKPMNPSASPSRELNIKSPSNPITSPNAAVTTEDSFSNPISSNCTTPLNTMISSNRSVTPTDASLDSSPEPLNALSNPMTLSPSLSPVSRTEDNEANEEAMETLRVYSDNEECSPAETCEDITMTELSTTGINPSQVPATTENSNEDNALPDIQISSLDLDEDEPMDEESSIPAASPSLN